MTKWILVLGEEDRDLIFEALKEYWITAAASSAKLDRINELAERVNLDAIKIDMDALEIQKGMVQAQSLDKPKDGYWDGLANLLEDLCA